MPKRIVIIEDAPQVANILLSKLGREGHRPLWKRDWKEGLEEARRADLILLSTDLPRKDFWEGLAALKAASTAPILAVLETDEAGSEAKARELGAAGAIVKPFKPTVVARRVADLLGVH